MAWSGILVFNATRHFKYYFTYFAEISFIGVGNWSSGGKGGGGWPERNSVVIFMT